MRPRGDKVVYDATVTVMGIVHGLVGVSWMGIHVTNELFLVPDIAKAEKLADVPMLRNMKKISMVGAILGFLTLITGVIFMFVKWGFEFGRYSEPEPRTVVIALLIVVVVLALGMGFLRPLGMKIGKAASGLKPMDPFPDDFKADLKRIGVFARISSTLVTITFILMIVAINGGI